MSLILAKFSPLPALPRPSALPPLSALPPPPALPPLDLVGEVGRWRGVRRMKKRKEAMHTRVGELNKSDGVVPTKILSNI